MKLTEVEEAKEKKSIGSYFEKMEILKSGERGEKKKNKRPITFRKDKLIRKKVNNLQVIVL